MSESVSKREKAEAVVWEVLFYAAVVLLAGRAFLHTTQVQFLWNEMLHGKFISYSLWVQLFAATVVVGKTLRSGRFAVWETVLVVLSVIAFGRSFQMTGYEEIPGILILLVGAKDIPAKRITAVFFVLFAVLTGVILYECHQGTIANWYFVSGTVRSKQALGFLYPNEFAAHVFFLFLMWALLRRGRITFVELAVMCFAVYLVWSKSSPRTFLLSSAALLVVLLFAKTSHHVAGMKKFLESRVIGILLLIVPLVIAALALYLAKVYDPAVAWTEKLNQLFTNRLALGAAGLRDYGVKLFGQELEMIGVSYRGSTKGYNFLDCSYVNILIRYGLAPFAMVLILFFVQGVRAVKRRDSLYLALLCLVAVQGFMEHHLVDFAYHPFFALALAAWPVKKPKVAPAEPEVAELFPEEPEEAPVPAAAQEPGSGQETVPETPAEAPEATEEPEGAAEESVPAPEAASVPEETAGTPDEWAEEAAEAVEEQAAEEALVEEVREALEEERKAGGEETAE